MTLIDLRSDTVTRPTASMRAAMAAAEVGDDVYGDDPTVRALEERVQALLGKPAAVFVPTGTMANQVSIRVHTRPGDEVLMDAGSHVFHYEGGAAAALAGVQIHPIPSEDGVFAVDAMLERVRPRAGYYPRSRLVCVENTHNRGGGTVWPLERLQAVSRAARERGLLVHLDGARLWNAHVATGVPLEHYAACADTVSVCLSKGLGAPAGSLVVGGAEVIAEARRIRHQYGGSMRQVGILAAAGLHALEHHLPRLVEDHAKARRLAELLAASPGVRVDPARVQTNMVYLDVPDAPALAAALREDELLCNALSPTRLRLVTHMDVAAEDIPVAAARISALTRARR